MRGFYSDTAMYVQLTSWDNLLLAYRRPSRGKRPHPAVATVPWGWVDRHAEVVYCQ
jgi:hypothetical protein